MSIQAVTGFLVDGQFYPTRNAAAEAESAAFRNKIGQIIAEQYGTETLSTGMLDRIMTLINERCRGVNSRGAPLHGRELSLEHPAADQPAMPEGEVPIENFRMPEPPADSDIPFMRIKGR